MTSRAAQLTLALLALFIVATVSHAQNLGPVCGNPGAPCKSSYSFKPYQLPFVIKQPPVFGKTYKSFSFYSVIVKSLKANSSEECAFVSEEERTQLQQRFADRKVFVSKFACPEELILYSNVNQEFNFLAVYADTTLAKAKEVLKKVQAHYPQAYLKKMQVILEYST